MSISCCFQVIEVERIDYLKPLPLDEIIRTLIRYTYEAKPDLSEGAIKALRDAVVAVPELMAPYFDAIVQRADDFIFNTNLVLLIHTTQDLNHFPILGLAFIHVIHRIGGTDNDQGGR